MTRPLHVTDLMVQSPRGAPLLVLPHLRLGAGQSLGIRGPSGAGKTTLLHALAGLADHVSGQVRWGETDLVALGTAQRAAFRARHIGLIFQDFLLFDELGPLANAAVAALYAPRNRRADLRSAAEQRLRGLGINPAPRTVASFSGGERQRVAVARALAHDPGILLADEPTASLDREAADRLAQDLATLSREGGKTLIVVSHDAVLLDRMDHVLNLQDGGPI